MPTLFVGNLPFAATDVDIVFHFAAFGCTAATMQHHEDSGRSKGFALVTVNADVTTVSAQMHDTEFQGRTLIVREDRPRADRPKREPRGDRPPRRERAPRESRGSGGGGYNGDRNQEPAPCDTVYVGNLPW